MQNSGGRKTSAKLQKSFQLFVYSKGVVLKVLLVHAKVAKYFTQRTQRVDNQYLKLRVLCVFLASLRETKALLRQPL